MDWLDLLAVQGTLKSLLQHHSSKASVLWCSAFFIVQLSHPYMTTGKIIVLTRWTFVGKVISLLFNMIVYMLECHSPKSSHPLPLPLSPKVLSQLFHCPHSPSSRGSLIALQFIQFSHSVVSDSLEPHKLQHTRPPCPSPTPGVHPNHVHWVGDAIQPSHPLSPPSLPAFNLSQHQGLFKLGRSLPQVVKELEFQLQHQSFQWIFRTDFL